MATIRYTTNGVSWITSSISLANDALGANPFVAGDITTEVINNIEYSNDVYAASGENGMLLRGTTPSAFNTAFPSIGNFFERVEINALGLSTDNYGRNISYGNGVWLAMGGYHVIRSTDTVTWTSSWSKGAYTGSSQLSIAYGQGIWTLVGYSGIARTSTDGISWTSRAPLMTNIAIGVVAYANGTWVLGGQYSQIRSSTNAITWTTRIGRNITGDRITALQYGNGIWLAAAGLFVKTSTNLVTWTTRSPIPSTSDGGPAASYGAGLWVVSTANSLVTSTDLVTWTTRTYSSLNLSSSEIRRIAYQNGVWAATSRTNIYSSTNGISWTTITVSPNIFHPNKIFGGNTTPSGDFSGATGVAYGNSMFLVGPNDSFNTFEGSAAFFIKSSTSKVGTSITSMNKTNSVDNFHVIANQKLFRSRNFNTFYQDGLTWVSKNTNFGATNGTPSYSTFGQNLYAILASSLRFEVSTNGISWVSRTVNLAPATFPYALSYNNGVWVAVGNSAQVRTSTDTVTWTTRNSTFGANDIYDVAYGNNNWIFVGAAGQIRTTTDFITWVTRTATSYGANYIYRIAYGNGLWAFSGGNGNRNSTDTITWVTANTTSLFNDIEFGNEIFASVDNTQYSPVLRTSTNGISWVSRRSSWTRSDASIWVTSLFEIHYGNGLWITMGTKGRIAVSTDAISWNLEQTPFTKLTELQISNSLTTGALTNGNGAWLIAYDDVMATSAGTAENNVLANGIVPLTASTYLVLCNNGIIHQYNSNHYPIMQRNTGINDNFIRGAVSASNIYHVVGQNAVYRSTDLFTWTTIATAPSNAQGFDTTNTGVTWTTRNAFFGTTAARGLGFGGPVTGSSTGWLAGGYSGQLRESTNGISWATVTFNFGTTRVTSIAYGNVWLIGGYAGQIRSSTNGITWVTRNANFTSSQAISNILYANSQWLVVGGAGQVQHSTDAISWTTRNAQTTNEFNTVGYGNGVWLVAGLSGTVRSSTDTISWTTITTGYTPTYRAIAYANGIWILTGNTSGIPGALQPVRSTDLVTWTTVSMGWNNNSFSYDPGPRQIAYANGLWVAGGQPDGAIYTSTDSISWVSRTNFSSFRGTTINNIAYGNGIWVGIGGYSTLPLSLTVTSPQIMASRPITDIIAI